jgi:multicomponent Na+:H+ antiporter subunit C
MDWLLQYHYNYLIYIVLMMIGLYGAIAKVNLVKKVISLSLFQTAVFLFYISMAVKEGGTAPITIKEGLAPGQFYTNPLPHVLILTAIVVSVSTTAVALALVIAIKRGYGTVEADELGEYEEL